MQSRRPHNVARVTKLVLAVSIVVASTMVVAPDAHSQQDMDPTWYDYRPEVSRTTQPSTPAANGKSKQQKNGPASRHHAANKARVKRQNNSNRGLATTSAK